MKETILISEKRCKKVFRELLEKYRNKSVYFISLKGEWELRMSEGALTSEEKRKWMGGLANIKYAWHPTSNAHALKPFNIEVLSHGELFVK